MSKAGSSSRGAASYLVRRLKTSTSSSSSSSSSSSVPSGSSTPSSLSSSLTTFPPSSSPSSSYASSSSSAAGRLSYYYDAALSHDHPLAAEPIVAEWTLSSSRASSTESASVSTGHGNGPGHGWPAGSSAFYQGNAHRARRRVPTAAYHQQRHQSTQSQSHSQPQTSAQLAAGSGYTSLRPSFWASASSREPAQEQPPQPSSSSSSPSSSSSSSVSSIFSPLLFGSPSTTSASTSSSSGASSPSGLPSSTSGILPAISSFISPSSPSPQPSHAPSSAATTSASPLARFGDATSIRVPQQPAVQGSSKAPQLTLHHGAFGIPKRPKQAPTTTTAPAPAAPVATPRPASVKGKERATEVDEAAVDGDGETASDAALLEKQLQELEGPLLSVQVGEDAYFVRHDSLGVADGVGGWAGRRGADPGLFAARLMHHCSAELAASLHDDRHTSAVAGSEGSSSEDADSGKGGGSEGPQFSFVSASSFSASTSTIPSSSSLHPPTPASAVGTQVIAQAPIASSRDAPNGTASTAAAAGTDTADHGQAHAQPQAHANSLESRLLASDPIELLHRAWDLTLTEFFDLSLTGSSTALVALLAGDELRVANLGDCSCSIIRGSPPEYIFRSQEQQHSFNYPFQAGTNSQDTPRKDGQRFNIKVQKGDIVILSSDGLVDNLFDEDILEEVEAFCPPPPPLGCAPAMSAGPSAGGSTSGGTGDMGEETEALSSKATASATTENSSSSSSGQQDAASPTAGLGMAASLNPQELSQALCARAKAVSEDQQAVASPFQQRANEEGIHFVGGKHDDISVLVAVIGDKA